MIGTHFEARFFFFISSERRDEDCTTTISSFRAPLNLTIYNTETTSQDLSQISALFSPVSDGFDYENNMMFPAITSSGMQRSFKENLTTEILQNERENGVVQLDISQNEMLDFLFANDDSIEDLDEKPTPTADLRARIIKRFTELYGNMSPCVVIEKSKYESAVTKRNKKGLRRIPRRNYARLNAGSDDSCISSNDNESSILSSKSRRKKCSSIKQNQNNSCAVCLHDFNTPRELHDHKLVCKGTKYRRENKKRKGTHLTIKKEESNRYSCPYCPFSYRDKMILANHKQYHALPKGEIYYCRVCGMTFRKPEMVHRHRKIHVNKRR